MIIKGSEYIEWMYPEIYGEEQQQDSITVALVHVRAAQDLQIKFDSKRNGWVISTENEIHSSLEEEVQYAAYAIIERAFIPAFYDDEMVK